MSEEKISALLIELNLRGIRYVHWKSNLNIERALRGEDDLDLLVHPDDKTKLFEVFKSEEIFRAFSIKDNWQPDIYHYLGFDDNSQALVHIHLHFSLTLGHDFHKNYTLPILDFYLQNRVKFKNVYLPEKEKELIILTLRLILKNSLRSFLLELPHNQIKILKASRTKVVSGGGIQEFLDLAQNIDRVRLKQIFRDEFHLFSYEEYVRFEKVLLKNQGLWTFFGANRTLSVRLAKHRTASDVEAFSRSLYRLFQIRISKVFGINPYSKTPEFGGRVIALVGGDGAGKSTNIETIKFTFSKHLKSRIFHIGRPPKSLLGNLVRLFKIPLIVVGKTNHVRAVSLLALGIDRRWLFEKSRHFANRGGISILDRIPLKGITTMDCPKVSQIDGLDNSWLDKLERRIYRSIEGVDQLFVLKLEPKIALVRRPEDNPAELLARSGEIWTNNWIAPFANEIDTGEKNPNEVSGYILRNIWKCISKDFKRIEVFGLNGAGKSFVTSILSQQIPNKKLSIPVKAHPIVLVSQILKYPSIVFTNRSFGILRTFYHFKASMALVEKWNREKRFPRTNFMLDQSLIFQLVFLVREGILDKEELTKNIETIKEFYTETYYLKADFMTLFERVNTRPIQEARALGMNYGDFVDFCLSYELLYNQVSRCLERTVEIDTTLGLSEDFFASIQ